MSKRQESSTTLHDNTSDENMDEIICSPQVASKTAKSSNTRDKRERRIQLLMRAMNSRSQKLQGKDARSNFPAKVEKVGQAEHLELRFVTKLPPIIYTFTQVKAEDGSPVRITLYDAESRAVITSGPLSSAWIELVVLDGHFGEEGEQDWKPKEFSSSIIYPRSGKMSLLKGDLIVKLEKGVGVINNIQFSDNSSWLRSRRFRLGARVAQVVLPGDEFRIKESISEAFTVKDLRGESYKKHYPLSLDDAVWRLKNISKGGLYHKQLRPHEIHSVKDLLRLHVTDPSGLKSTFGTKLSEESWEEIIKDATSCADQNDGYFYTYYDVKGSVHLLLDSIYKVVGASFDGQNYLFVNDLTPAQSLLMNMSKTRAYASVKNFVAVERYFFSPVDNPSKALRCFAFKPSSRETMPIHPPGLDKLKLKSTGSSHCTLPENQTKPAKEKTITSASSRGITSDDFPQQTMYDPGNDVYQLTKLNRKNRGKNKLKSKKIGSSTRFVECAPLPWFVDESCITSDTFDSSSESITSDMFGQFCDEPSPVLEPSTIWDTTWGERGLPSLFFYELPSICRTSELLQQNIYATYLIQLNLQNIEVDLPWAGKQPLVNLKSLNFNYSKLSRIPDLADAQNLARLNLQHCVNLVEVSSIESLANLDYVNLKGCRNLKSLPSMLGLKSLDILVLTGCTSFEQLPDQLSTSTKRLCLSGTAIEELPATIGCLTGLIELDLSNCEKLKKLPSSIFNLTSLETLNVTGCIGLMKAKKRGKK